MKVSRLLIVAAVSTACGGAVVPKTAATAQAPAGDKAAQTVAAAKAGPTVTNPADAEALAGFKVRVDTYVNLHKELAKGIAAQKETNNPAQISAAKAALAAKIQGARADAKHGDIFAPQTRAAFRRLLAPELKGEDGRDAKAVLKDDAPAPGTIKFKVNAKYPESQPLPSVPANLLLNLPTLPEPLEYRIVDKHLILLDTAADLVVDYVPNAIK